MRVVSTSIVYVLALLAAISFAGASIEHRHAAESKLWLVTRQGAVSVESVSVILDSELEIVRVSGNYVHLLGNQIGTLFVSPEASNVSMNANLIEVWRNPPLRLWVPPEGGLDFGGNHIAHVTDWVDELIEVDCD